MTIRQSTNWHDATRLVQEAESILVVTHVNPDGDAIGSLMGLTNFLLNLGKQVECAVDGGNLSFLSFIPGVECIQDKLVKGEWDLMISVDASDEERTGEVGIYGRENSKKVLNIDHHVTNTMFGDVQLVNSLAVSATEVLFDWMRAMDREISVDVAVPLLTGLVTDTLGFRTSNVNAKTLAVAQELIQAGASLTEVTERALDNHSYPVVNLWRYALETVQLHKGGIVSVEITQESLKRAGLTDVTDGGIVGFLIKTDEAMIAVVFKEAEDGSVGVSIRTKPGFNASNAAFALGGGGHPQACGATIAGPMAEAKKRVIPMLQEVVKDGELTIA